MSEPLSKPTPLNDWYARSVCWVVISLASLVPMSLLTSLFQTIGAHDNAGVDMLHCLLAGSLHLLLWVHLVLGGISLTKAGEHKENPPSTKRVVWLLTVLGFQLVCLEIARELQDPDVFSLNIH